MMRCISILLAAVLLLMGCLAEGAPIENIITLSDAVTAEDYENARELVRLLFVAAAGTDENMEVNARKGMTNEEQLRRNEDNASYRKTVLPWLMDMLTVDGEKGIPRKTFLEHFVLEHITEDGQYEFLWEKEKKVFDYSDDMYVLLWDEMVGKALDCLKKNEFGKEYIEFVSSLTDDEMTDDLLNQMTRDYFRIWIDDIDPEGLEEMNEDFSFWLYGPSSPEVILDYPVVKHTDNDYYMNRMFNGEANAAGTLFLDYRNLPNLTDENTLVYGHNMRNYSMFGTLGRYEKQVYFESHPYMLIVAADEIDLVEIYTAHAIKFDDICYKISISEFLEALKYVTEIDAKNHLKKSLECFLQLLKEVDDNEETACLVIGFEEPGSISEAIEIADLKAKFIEISCDSNELMRDVDGDVCKGRFVDDIMSLWKLMKFKDADTVKEDFYNGIDEFMKLVGDDTLAEINDFFYNGINDYLTLLKFIDKTASESDFIYRIRDVRPYDRILTLSTCTNKGVDKRYVVEGRILCTWFDDEKWGNNSDDILIHKDVSISK